MLKVLLRPLAVAMAMMGAARAQPIELKVSRYLPPNHTVQKVPEDWAADLAKRSDGRLTLRIYPASQLGPVQRQFDLARKLASLPFTAPSGEETSAASRGGRPSWRQSI